jgi:hypothetical protein
MSHLRIVLLLLVANILGCQYGNDRNGAGGKTTSSSTNKTAQIAEFSYEINADKRAVRFMENGKVLSRRRFIDLLASESTQGVNFRSLVNKSVTEVPIGQVQGFELKSPVLNQDSESLPYYYLAIPANFSTDVDAAYANYFYNCSPALISSANADTSSDFQQNYLGIVGYQDGAAKAFEKSMLPGKRLLLKDAAVFLKSSPTNFLVSPCPLADPIKNDANRPLIHLRAFAALATKTPERANAFWLAVGLMAQKRFTESKTVFLNTHGHGVNYLHFRLESRPAYYPAEAQNLIEPKSSNAFYDEIFP